MQRDFILLQLSEDNVMSSVGRFGKSPPPELSLPASRNTGQLFMVHAASLGSGSPGF